MFDERLNIFKFIDSPYVITLIGPPNCGKSTFINYLKSFCIRKRLDHFNVISRDNILLETADTKDYNKAWESVDHNLVNEKLKEKINKLSNEFDNAIIDMTNMTSKGRINNNNKFKNHYKIAIVFEYNKEDIFKRNEERKEKEKKFIPTNVINSMIENYNEPTLSEGYNLIIKI